VSGGVLLAADDRDNVLYQAKLPELSALGGAKRLWRGPRQILVTSSFVYVVNEQSNILQVFQLDGGDVIDAGVLFPDGGPPSSGDGGIPLALGLQSEYSFDAGVAPQTVAAAGSDLFVTLYGGLADAGIGAAIGRVARLNVSNPVQPTLVEAIPMDGGAPFSRPTGIVVHAGSVYAALANLNAADAPDRPGILAKIDTPTGSVHPISLGPDCFRPQWITEFGDSLLVSCAGNILTDGGTPGGAPPTPAAIVLVDRTDQAGRAWKASCTPGTIGCPYPLISRFAVVGNRIYAADLVDGRLFVVEVDGGQLVERRGLAGDAGPIRACPGTGITDIVTVP
jgi:hypothetical protein